MQQQTKRRPTKHHAVSLRAAQRQQQLDAEITGVGEVAQPAEETPAPAEEVAEAEAPAEEADDSAEASNEEG